ncbi:hypothetical protein HY971_04160 [Candidatus Kaiserbacteria bacterium]|nr:hypothetical protein [Candidatus Kaiserbacteria bacterium]
MSITFKFVAVSLAMLGAMEALFFTGNMPPVPGIGFIFVAGSSLAGFIAYRIYRARKSPGAPGGQQGEVLKLLQWYFVTLCVFWIVDIFPHVFLIMGGASLQTLTVTHWTAHIFLGLTAVIAAGIAMTFFAPRFKTRATIFTVILMAAALAFSAVYPDHLAYIPGSEYPLISADPLFSLFYTIASIITSGFFGLYLIYKGLGSQAPLRMRAVSLGLGFVAQVLIGVVIAYMHTWYAPAFIYLFIWAWVVFPGISALSSSGQNR